MVRQWIRQALGASGVAILVPAAIIVALALSAAGGGSGLRSLGQVLNGPAVPPAEAAQTAGKPQRIDVRGTAPRAAVPRRAASKPSASAPVRRRAAGGRPPVRRPSSGRPPAARPPSSTPSGGSGSSPAPSPAPAPPPHPIQNAGSQIAGIVQPLPVAGPVAADVVQAVVDLVDPPA